MDPGRGRGLGARGAAPRGRGLWPMVLLLACAMVATDFVRHPFAGAPPGSAAGGERELTLWTAGTDAGAPAGQLARAAARALDRPGSQRVRVRAVDGGAGAAVTGLLDDATGRGADLLVVHAGTFADLERERRLAGVPDVAARAARAERLLLRARPVALLADDPLLLAATRPAAQGGAGRGGAGRGSASRRAPIASAEALIAALRDSGDGIVLGVEGGPWSRNALAAVIDAADARGRVRYRVLPADDEAAFLARGAVDAVVGTASVLRRSGVAKRLRPLAVSGGDWAAPAVGADVPELGSLVGVDGRVAGLSRWIAVVAAPSLEQAQTEALTRRLRVLAASARWRRTVARLGLAAPARVRNGASPRTSRTGPGPRASRTGAGPRASRTGAGPRAVDTMRAGAGLGGRARGGAWLLADAHDDARALTLLADRLDRGAAGR